MSKLNALGLELLELKEAMASDYPAVVKKALNQTINDLLKNELIDQETHYLLTEPVFAFHDFKNLCLEKPAYCKSEEELMSLYEEKRVRLEEALQRCIKQQQVSVVNYIKDEQIMVVKTYHFGLNEVKKYFGIQNDEDCQSLMGRKRFVERFVALRYPKIMKGFVNQYRNPNQNFRLAHSSVYYDEECQDYAIELLFKIDIETFEEIEVSAFERPISKMIERCNQWFTDHLGVDGDFYTRTQSHHSKPKEELKKEVTPPSNRPAKAETVELKKAPEVQAPANEPIQETSFNVPVVEDLPTIEVEPSLLEEPVLSDELDASIIEDIQFDEVTFELPDLTFADSETIL